MKPKTTADTFPFLPNAYNIGAATGAMHHKEPSICITDNFQILLNNPKDGESPKTVTGLELLSEMERVCGSRHKEKVMARMSIVIL